MSRKLLLQLANLVVAGCYVTLAVTVATGTFTGMSSVSGGLLIMAMSLAQAFGHARLKIWAVKITAALAGVINILAIPYLLATFEPDLLPPLQQRVSTFALITVCTGLLVLNYRILCKTDLPKGVPV